MGLPVSFRSWYRKLPWFGSLYVTTEVLIAEIKSPAHGWAFCSLLGLRSFFWLFIRRRHEK